MFYKSAFVHVKSCYLQAWMTPLYCICKGVCTHNENQQVRDAMLKLEHYWMHRMAVLLFTLLQPDFICQHFKYTVVVYIRAIQCRMACRFLIAKLYVQFSTEWHSDEIVMLQFCSVEWHVDWMSNCVLLRNPHLVMMSSSGAPSSKLLVSAILCHNY